MSKDRREFLKTMTASVLVPGAIGAMPARAAAAMPGEGAAPKGRNDRKGKPNVLLMICDDLGFGDLGCYGSAIPTPNLDRLAAEGTRCMRYNTPHPICSAARAALLTGRYAQRSHTTGAYMPNSKTGMAREEQTLANLFRDAGYRTHAMGKWHLGDMPGYLPTDRGFDTFLGVPWSDDMQPLPMFREASVLEPETDRDELTPRYTAEALSHLGSASEQPFFAYVAFSYPHDPARGSMAFKGRSQFGDFGDSVEEIDWSVGQMLAVLERTGKADDTIVIFTSDHGPWFQGSPGKLRGRKGTAFEGGVRVPFLVRWSGKVPAAAVCEEWIGHLNVLPTLATWCGLEQPRLPLDGFDASATLLHGATAPAKPVLYFTPAAGNKDVHCIRKGAWKLRVAQNDGEIYINDHTQGRNNYLLAKPELYHLERDPCESYDVAKKFPEMVSQLHSELEREVRTFPRDIQDSYAALCKNVANLVTPPGATPRILTGTQPDWAWEPEDRR